MHCHYLNIQYSLALKPKQRLLISKAFKAIPLMLLVSLLTWPILTFSQQPPQLQCLEVVGDGVLVSWTPPADLTGFQHYKVHYSPFGIVYTDVSGPFTNLQFQHDNIQTLLGSRHFFIEAVFDNGSAMSDTLQSIWLRLDNFAPDFNPVLLVWNALSEPDPNGADPNYDVYQEFPPGSDNWVLKASLAGFQYSETVLVCDDSVNYKVVQVNNNGCISVSNINGARFATIIEPPPPVIDSISTDINGQAVFGWEPSDLASAYFVFRWEGNQWKKIDTTQNTYYVDTSSNACMNRYSYTVEMRDTCLNDGPKDETEARTNMLLDTLIYGVCDKNIRIEWTPYQFPDPDHYEIWCSIDGQTYVKVGEVDGNTTVFDHPNPQIQSQYTYYVRARFAGGSSTTCTKSVFTPDYTRPGFIYFQNADVLPGNDIQLNVFVDTIPSVCGWELWRSELNGGSPSLIQSLTKNQSTISNVEFMDTTADPNAGFYQYFVKALDSCQYEAFSSNELKTIWLTGEKMQDNENQLNWNAFEGWDETVEKYYIYRMIGEQLPNKPFDSVAANVFTYTDFVDASNQQNGKLTYWVQAVETTPNAFGEGKRSTSNRIRLFLESSLYMPNAFKPGGVSPEFKPVFTYFGGSAYLFQIYNRWGQLIYSTENPDEGWDGSHQGNMVPQGIYVFRLVSVELSGNTNEQKGSFTVIY